MSNQLNDIARAYGLHCELENYPSEMVLIVKGFGLQIGYHLETINDLAALNAMPLAFARTTGKRIQGKKYENAIQSFCMAMALSECMTA